MLDFGLWTANGKLPMGKPKNAYMVLPLSGCTDCGGTGGYLGQRSNVPDDS